MTTSTDPADELKPPCRFCDAMGLKDCNLGAEVDADPDLSSKVPEPNPPELIKFCSNCKTIKVWFVL